MADNTFLVPLSPIQRSKPSDRLLKFRQNEFSIYNKFGPYEQAGGGRGPNQPFIYTRLTDSNSKKKFTSRDTQALPVGSTIRDTERMIKFLRSGTGISFLATQAFLQADNTFDETRTYNIGSPIAATTIPILGVRPIRHIESNGGILNFFVTSLLSTIGISGANANRTSPIPGTATGTLSTYVQAKRNGRYGVMRANTAASGIANVNKIWVGAGGAPRPVESSGFLQTVARTLFSTSGLFSGAGRAADYQYRPEYKTPTDNMYRYMRSDINQILSYGGRRPLYLGKVGGQIVSTGKFYNDAPNPFSAREIADATRAFEEITRENEINAQFNRAAIPDFDGTIEQRQISPVPVVPESLDATIVASEVAKNSATRDKSYANIPQMADRLLDQGSQNAAGIEGLYNKMLRALSPAPNDHPMYHKSAERYENNAAAGINRENNYDRIPDKKEQVTYDRIYSDALRFSADSFGVPLITIDQRSFAKSSTLRINERGIKEFKTGQADTYNKLDVIDEAQIGLLKLDNNQSKDIIFFYFHDLVNKKYVPFRATITSLSEQNSPDWEELKYIGRADRLFVYKGFTRDITFSFKVYANSIDELIPMWKRINYLTGFSRPSKYTSPGVTTNESAVVGRPDDAVVQMSPFRLNETFGATGFIYPPMIDFRIGDLYVDQPGVIRSISVSIPDDASWETLRADTYKYINGIQGQHNVIEKDNIKSRQLPNMVDVTMQISLLEKDVSIINGQHYGPIDGWESAL